MTWSMEKEEARRLDASRSLPVQDIEESRAWQRWLVGCGGVTASRGPSTHLNIYTPPRMFSPFKKQHTISTIQIQDSNHFSKQHTNNQPISIPPPRIFRHFENSIPFQPFKIKIPTTFQSNIPTTNQCLYPPLHFSAILKTAYHFNHIFPYRSGLKVPYSKTPNNKEHNQKPNKEQNTEHSKSTNQQTFPALLFTITLTFHVSIIMLDNH